VKSAIQINLNGIELIVKSFVLMCFVCLLGREWEGSQGAHGCWERSPAGRLERVPPTFRGDPHVWDLRLHWRKPVLHEPPRQGRSRWPLQFLLQGQFSSVQFTVGLWLSS